MKYFIRSHFTDWHEVPEEQFNRFKKTMCSFTPGIPASEKETWFMRKYGKIEKEDK